jgi:GNAT superfamily N-acetyltransferase
MGLRRNCKLSNIEIRRPEPGDVKELKQFFTIVIKDTFAKEGLADRVNEIKKEIQDKENLLKKDFKSNGKDQYFLIALDKAKIIGTIEYGPTSQLVIDCTNGELKDIVEVGTVFVHPAYQKQGVGTLLLNMIYLIFLYRNIKEFCLDSGYCHAQKVWQKKFGTPDYVLKDYWGKGHNHMIWRKPISDIQIVFRI